MEQTYSKEVVEVIAQSFCHDYLEYREDGVYIHEGYVENDPLGLFTWTPACELEGSDAPDALTAPALPIPFTARELGAFLLHGVGAHIVGCYGGSYESGPDEGMLKDLGIRAGKAREALRAAYAAILDAQNAVGTLNYAKQSRAAELRKKYADEYDIVFERENVMERVIVGKHKNGNPEFGDDIPRDEYLLRLARAKEAVATLKLQLLQTETEANTERSAWLKGMVQQLLQPLSATADSLVELDGTNQTPDAERRLARLLELGGSSKYKDSNWTFTGIANLVQSEKKELRKRSDAKTIRADLKEAAQSKHDAKRAGVFNGLGQR